MNLISRYFDSDMELYGVGCIRYDNNTGKRDSVLETAFARSVRISCIPEIIRWGGEGHCLSVSEVELPFLVLG